MDQNSVSHFCMENDSFLWRSCRENGLMIIVPDPHLAEICLSTDPMSLAAPAARLGAFYLSNEKEAVLEKTWNM